MTFVAAVFEVLAGALAVSAVGWAVSRSFTNGLTRSEKIAWSFAVGLLAQAILFLIAVSIRPGHPLVPLLVLDAVLVSASLVVRGSASPPPPRVPGRPIVIALLAVTAIAWGIFLVSALSDGMWGTDYLAMWGLKGKTIFETGSVPRRLFQDPALLWGRPDHPLLVPLSLAALASLGGGWNDQALALLFPLCELATILGAWGFLARRVSPLAGASAAALISVSFRLYHSGNCGLAEIPLALGLVMASSAFFDVLETRSRSAMVRLFSASLFCAWTKPEGTLFVLLLAVVLWVRHRMRPFETLKSGGWALVVPPVVHAGLMFLLARPRPQRDFDLTFLEPRRWSELLSRFGLVIARIFGTEVFRVWVPVLAIGLFLLLTRRGLADLLLAVLALQFLGYLAAFSISTHDPMWKVDSCFDRIVATLLPSLALVLGARVGRDDARQSVGEPGSTAVEAATSRIG